MSIDWNVLKSRHELLTAQLSSPSLSSQERQTLGKEHVHLAALLEKNNALETVKKNLQDMQTQLVQTHDSDMKELFSEEIISLQALLEKHQKELEDLLYPPDEMDNRSVFLEVRAGTGGQEAALFAADLVKMYANYAMNKGWHVSVDFTDTDLGGVREATLHIEGRSVYAHLKHESGVHRVQRVPKTETAGRVHTSTATVAVLPEAEEVEFSISPQDLRIDTYRASGAGGQHVNKTDSAIRITHIPSGIVVACQEERSQHKNRSKAMKMLQSRLLAVQKEKQIQEESQKRKEMVGGATRAEKVRTYNFPQNRITDHQVDLTLKKLDRVMEGDLDEIVTALMNKERQERRAKAVV